MKTFALFCLTLIMIGCAATLGDVQREPPIFNLISEIPAKTLANKIAYESAQESKNSRFFPSWNPVQIIDIDGTQKLLVTFTSRGNILLMPYPPQPVAELTIIPEDSGGSRVEYRAINWVDRENFWAMVKQCASSSQNSPEK